MAVVGDEGIMCDLGVVVLHWRYWPGVRRTIDAVLGEGIAPERICIVDNASGDGSLEAIRSRYPQCRVVELEQNLGYAGGMNAGIRAVGGEHILLLTHECVLRPRSIGALVARLESSSTTGIVGPMLVRASRPDTVFSEGGVFVGRRMMACHLSSGDALAGHVHDGPRRVEWLDGACLLVRTAVFEAIGPFDESYFLYFEEVDFQVRARRAGWVLECEPCAVADQDPGAIPRALWVRNRLRFLARHGTRVALLRQITDDVCVVFGSLAYPDSAHWRRAYLVVRGLLAPITRTSPRRLDELSRQSR